jgi:hypothetical protein
MAEPGPRMADQDRVYVVVFRLRQVRTYCESSPEPKAFEVQSSIWLMDSPFVFVNASPDLIFRGLFIASSPK